MQLAHIDQKNIRGTYNRAQNLNRRGEMMDEYLSYIFSMLAGLSPG